MKENTMLGFIKTTAIAAVLFGATIASAQTRLTGAGATFPNPLYQRWVNEYQKSHPNVQINYNSIGSGGGIKNITEKTIDFAGSDAPLSKKELDALGGDTKVVQFPATAGGVVPAYNLPGFSGELKLSGEVIADIYLGKVKKWNDPKIAALNTDAKLPDLSITPAWRSDGSGTTFVFTSYLATQSEEFKGKVGAAKSVQFPIGQGGQGNDGVAAVVTQTPGAFGYIELAFAHQNKIAFAAVKNKNGKFIKASPESIAAAGAGAVDMMKGNVIAADIWNQPGDAAYPISAFTYLIVYKDLNNIKSKEQATALVEFLKWTVGDGQQFAAALDYAPLVDAVKKKSLEAIGVITYEGKALMSMSN
jgi:phosphate transport system substrate-binding protein